MSVATEPCSGQLRQHSYAVVRGLFDAATTKRLREICDEFSERGRPWGWLRATWNRGSVCVWKKVGIARAGEARCSYLEWNGGKNWPVEGATEKLSEEFPFFFLLIIITKARQKGTEEYLRKLTKRDI